MAVYKDEKISTWRAIYRYVDWTGEKKQTQKSGFKTMREAQAWEREQLNKATSDLDMSFAAFVQIYTADLQSRLKQNTWLTKKHIIETTLLPAFGVKGMNDIRPADIIQWQNEMIAHRNEHDKPYSETYLKTIHNQLSAIFNHAVRFYELNANPAQKAGNMGKERTQEMLFWTKEEYLKFANAMMDKPISFYAFEVLYWCGIRLGELLALMSEDFDFEKSYLHHEMGRGSKEQGIKRIRIHDLRRSHVSFLIEMGFSAVAIADRVGHESIDITYRYAHPFPSKQAEIADKLSIERQLQTAI